MKTYPVKVGATGAATMTRLLALVGSYASVSRRMTRQEAETAAHALRYASVNRRLPAGTRRACKSWAGYLESRLG